jgi:hypothetical protein
MDDDIDGDGYLNDEDDYPYDPNRWERKSRAAEEQNLLLYIGAGAVAILIAIFIVVILRKKQKEELL